MKNRHIWLILCASVVLWIVVGSLPLVLFNSGLLQQSTKDTPGIDTAAPGTFGDSFGMATSLFNGLALAGVIIAITLQSKELSLQRDELRLTRDELKRSADAQREAQRALESQARMSFLTAYLQALAASEASTTETEDQSSLRAARARVRGIRVRHEVDTLLRSLGPDLKTIGVNSTENPGIHALEMILDLAEELNEVQAMAFGVEDNSPDEQKAALLERIFRLLPPISRKFDVILQTVEMPDGAHRVVSQGYTRLRAWRERIDAARGEALQGLTFSQFIDPAAAICTQLSLVAGNLALTIRPLGLKRH